MAEGNFKQMVETVDVLGKIAGKKEAVKPNNADL